MLSLVVGTSVIVFPQVGLPVAGVLAVGKGLNALRNGRKRSRAPAPSESLQDVTRPAPVTLTFKDVTCTLEGKTSTKTLLKGVSGQASPGRLLAILGPSGSGKTTLLNTLASQVPTNKHLTLSGELTINGKPATESNHRQAYVQQEDVFYSQLTVHETLTMAAELRLPPGTSAEGKRAYVDTLLATLGLTKVAGTRVGDAKRRGLSGGEKKRLSLGCELVGSPSLIFLDEPTSGLDAAAAQKVMSTLKTLAAEGHTVVCSIHQPRSSIWDMFDDLILLHEGSVVYEGPANEALAHFASLGHVCPPAYNPAEFLSDLISADFSATDNNNNGGEEGRSRVQQLVEAWERQPRVPSVEATATKGLADDAAIHEGVGVPPQPLVPWGQQFKLLARRSWRQVVRDKVTTISRIGANVSSAIVFGIIFWRMGRSQSAIQDRMGLMQVVAINTAMASLAKTLNVFPRERLIVNRERARNSYSTAAYLSGKLLAELPMGAVFPLLFGVLVYPVCGLNPRPARFANFLGIVTLASFASSAFGMVVGAFAPSTEAALAIGPAAMTVWIVFGGYYVNADNVPRALKWLPRASLIKQAFSALTVNEMDGTTFEPDAQGRGMTDGKQVLDWLSFGNTTVRSANIQQLRILAFYYMATYSVLKMNKPVFQRMLAPQPNTIVEASAVVPAPPPPAAQAQSTTPATASGTEQATPAP